MGLDSSGRSPSLPRNGIAGDRVGGYLLAARASLMQTMEKTKEVEMAISKSGLRLQGMKESLPALEAAMKPLQGQALVQKGVGAKIDRAAEPAEMIIRTFEVVRSLESIIRGDPRRDLGEYLASLSQLEEAMDFLSQNCGRAVLCISDAVSFLARTKAADNYRMYRLNERLTNVLQDIKSDEGNRFDMGLLEIALGKLDLEFRRLLLEHSGPLALPEKMPEVEFRHSSTPEDGIEVPEPEPTSLPPILPFAATDMLQIIVERLSYHNWTDNLLEMYRDCRLVSIKGSLQLLGTSDYLRHSTPEAINGVAWTELERMIGFWCDHIEVACKILFKGERRLCTRVFSKVDKTKWIRCWGKLGTAGFLPFLAFGEAVAQSRIAPEKLFKLLDMYDVIEKCHHSVLEMFEGGDPACGEIILRARGLQKKVVYRASETLSSFIGMVEEERSDVPRFGERSLLASYVMNYAGFIASDYSPLLAKVLRIHKRMELEEGAESPDDLLALRVQQMVGTLEKRLIERSKAYSDNSLGYIFLMNNYFYMICHVKGEDSRLLPLLGDQWHKDMLGKLRQSTLHYQRETWGKMLKFLNRDGLQSSSGSRGTSREIARQRLRSFTHAFDETCQKHGHWTIPAEDLRCEVELAVTQMLVPAYRSYTQTFKHLLEQGGTRHMKYTAEEIEQILDDLFQLRAQDSRPRNGTTGNSHPNTPNGNALK